MLCEMQSVSSRIWTRVAVSNSYDDNTTPRAKTEIRHLVNWTLVIHKHETRGQVSWTEYLNSLERKAYIQDFDMWLYDNKDAIKDAVIYGMQG